MPASKTASGEITLQRIGRAMARVPVVGTTPLIVHKFSAKAQQAMLDKHMGKTVTREHKDPEALFQGAQHFMEDGTPGLPAVAFKAAIVDAARFFPGSKLTMVGLRRMVLVNGERGNDKLNRSLLTRIYGEYRDDHAKLEPAVAVMRQDVARNDSGVADIRFRPEFDPWCAVLEVVYLKSIFTLETIVNLVDAAGINGVGEWRPASKESNTGSYGTWQVPDGADVREVVL